ncbi:MAG: GTPase HflX [Clostridiaceae bacterium]
MDREISGNTQSLKATLLEELRNLYGLEPDSGSFLPEQLVVSIAAISCNINREIAVYINRKGSILDISIGDSGTVSLSQVEGRRNKARLSGVRCIHTHPNGDSMLSAVDINSLLVMNLDAMVAVGVSNGKVTGISAALPKCQKVPDNQKVKLNDRLEGNCFDAGFDGADLFRPFVSCAELDSLFEHLYELDRFYSSDQGYLQEEREKAILVGLDTAQTQNSGAPGEAQRSLDELGELAGTAGLAVLEKVLQKRPSRDAAFYIGRGKIEQLSLMLQALSADTLVFDDELSGAQIRNIEGQTGVKVLDRTMLILDIFAQRARSSEGKLQVELAQLKYRLPRLTGLGGQLSRLGGGIGTRGPGEKKLEVDRRHIRRRVGALEAELDNIAKRRGLSRESRRRNDVPVAALVGYTNSGKSTLLNNLCNADVLVEDKLFATLDPTTRKLVLPNGKEILLVDTVGFIRKLPHELVEAFKSTLEEAVCADLLLHVVDVSDSEADEHIRVTENLLQSLGAAGKPVLMVLNKQDKISDSGRLSAMQHHSNCVEVSALTGFGMESLLSAITAALLPDEEELLLQIPYDAGWVIPYIHENGSILNQEYLQEGISARVKLKRSKADKVREFVIS